MPNWKKVIVSGSNVSQLNNDGVYLRTTGDGVISSSAQLTIEFDTRYLNTIGDSVLSSSAQIATDISGAFTAASGGFSTRITSLEGAGGTTFSSSVSTRLTNVEGYTLDNVTDNGSSTTNVITVGGLTVNGNATITGTLTAQQFNTEFVSSSIIFESGSTKFGDSSDDVHSFTGSINLTGSANTYLTIKAASEPGLFLNTSDGNYDSLLFNGYGTLGLAYYQNDGGLANKSATTYPIYYYAGGSNANTAYTQFQVNGTNTVYFRKSGIEVGTLTADVHSFTGSIKLNTQTAATTDTDKFLVFDTGGQIKYRTGAEVLSDINPGGLISSSAQLTTEFDTRYLNTTGDNVISSSAQLTIEFDTRYLNTIGDSVLSSSAQIATDISGAFTATSGGFSTRITSLEAAGGTTFSSSVSTRLTNVEGYTLDNVTDNGSSTTNVITVGGLTVNGNATITGTLTAQQFNTEFVSSSIIFESGSTKFGDSVDDIHSFTGSVKLNTQTAATTDTDKFLVFDSGGEIKYRTGAEVLGDINPGGLVSSSAQLTTEFDTRYLNTTGDGVISSSAQLTSTFDTRYLNTTGDNVLSSSAQIASEISGAFTGAGFVDVGSGASGSRLAIWQDTNTIKGNSNVVLYENYIPLPGYVAPAGIWESTSQSGIQSKTIITDGLLIGTPVTTGNFTASISLFANTGPAGYPDEIPAGSDGWYAKTQLDSFNFATAPTNQVIHLDNFYTAFISYWVSGYQGYRSGQIVISADGVYGNSAIHTEFSTVSIGNTSDVEFSVGIVSGSISLYLTAGGATQGTFEIKKFIALPA